MKQMIWMGAAVGSILGGLVPELWGAGALSFSSLLFGTAGGMLGIYVAYRLTH